jgi:hypothetical protein
MHSSFLFRLSFLIGFTEELLDREPQFHGFPIIDNPNDRLVTGFIARSDLEFELDKLSESQLHAAAYTRVHFSREPPPFESRHFVDFSAQVDKVSASKKGASSDAVCWCSIFICCLALAFLVPLASPSILS